MNIHLLKDIYLEVNCNLSNTHPFLVASQKLLLLFPDII